MARNRIRYPAIPFIFLYDVEGDQVFTNAGQFHIWDFQQTKTSHFKYNLNDDRVYLHNNQYGFYEITFECSFITYANATITLTTQIYKNGLAVTGSSVASAVTGAAGDVDLVKTCQSVHFIIYLKGTDYIQIKTITDSASDVLSIEDTSRLMIKFIPVRGWNNDAGGRITNRKGII